MHDFDLIRAKIDGWWDYKCKRIEGNRTFAKFLTWFDDIQVGSAQESDPPDGFAQALILRSGSPDGRRIYQEIVEGIIDEDAKVRTLISYGYAKEESHASHIIGLYEPRT
jgi:hypothetical protein